VCTEKELGQGMIKIIITTLIVQSIILLVGCKSAGVKDNLVGSWESSVINGGASSVDEQPRILLDIESSGVVSIQTINRTQGDMSISNYQGKINGDNFQIEHKPEGVRMVNNDSYLTLLDDEKGESIVFKRREVEPEVPELVTR